MGKPIPNMLIHYNSTTTIEKIENRNYNGKRCQIRKKHNIVREISLKDL